MPMKPILPEEPDISLVRGASPYTGGVDPFATIGGFSDGFDTEIECARACAWPTCVTDPAAVKTVAGVGDEVRFRPIWLYYAESCGVPTPYTQQIAQRALATFTAIQSAPLAHQLWTGVTDNAQPSLRSAAQLIPSSLTPLSPVAAVSRLVAARRRVSGSGHVVVHAPWVIVQHLVAEGLVRASGGRFVGQGFTMIVDNGYPDDGGFNLPGFGVVHSGPASIPPAAPTPGEAWLYVTGRIEVELSPLPTPDEWRSTSVAPDGVSPFYHTFQRRNEWMVLVERLAFYRFDPCSVYAQSVSIPT